MDRATQAKLDAETDKGFELTDVIETNAKRATREARGNNLPRKTNVPASKPDLTPPVPVTADAPPNRAAIQLEEWI